MCLDAGQLFNAVELCTATVSDHRPVLGKREAKNMAEDTGSVSSRSFVNNNADSMQNMAGSACGSVPCCLVLGRLLKPVCASTVKSGAKIWPAFYWAAVRIQQMAGKDKCFVIWT